MKIILLLIPLLSVGCSSNPYRIDEFKSIALTKSQSAGSGEVIGLNGSNELMTQKRYYIAEEYRLLKNEVYSLEARVYGVKEYGSIGLYGVYTKCIADLADPENGGNGTLSWTEERDKVVDQEKKLKVGLEGDMVVGIEENYYELQNLKFKQYKRILEQRETDYEKKILVCELKKKTQIAKFK